MTLKDLIPVLAISVPVLAIVAIGVRSYWYREYLGRRGKRPLPHELPPIDCTPRWAPPRHTVSFNDTTDKVIVRQNVIEMPMRGDGPKDGAA